jgi:hypothetical protein
LFALICTATSTFCQLQTAADNRRLKTATSTIHQFANSARNQYFINSLRNLRCTCPSPLTKAPSTNHTFLTVMTNESCYMPPLIHKQRPPQQRFLRDSIQSLKYLQPVSNMSSTCLKPVNMSPSCLYPASILFPTGLLHPVSTLSPTCFFRYQTYLQPVSNLSQTCIQPASIPLSPTCHYPASIMSPI